MLARIAASRSSSAVDSMAPGPVKGLAMVVHSSRRIAERVTLSTGEFTRMTATAFMDRAYYG